MKIAPPLARLDGTVLVEFPSNRQSSTTTPPALAIHKAPPCWSPWQPWNTQLRRVNVHWSARIAPPTSLDMPFRIVMPSINDPGFSVRVSTKARSACWQSRMQFSGPFRLRTVSRRGPNARFRSAVVE
jgi:hypothetical protein